MEPLPFVITCAALLLGAMAQRTVGMGFGLVVTPTVVLALGPVEAVLVVNVFGTIVCAVIIGRVWRDIAWRRLWWLLVPAVLLTVPGILLSLAMDTDLLKVIVGVLAIVGVVVSVGFTRTSHTLDGPATRITLGGLTGLLNSSVGLGAPTVGIFGIVSRWEHAVYAATLQPFWLLLSGTTTIARQLIEPEGAPAWPWWAWLIACGPLVVGAVAGDALAPRIDRVLAKRLVVAFSVLGGVAVLVAGIIGLSA